MKKLSNFNNSSQTISSHSSSLCLIKKISSLRGVNDILLLLNDDLLIITAKDLRIYNAINFEKLLTFTTIKNPITSINHVSQMKYPYYLNNEIFVINLN